MRLKTIIVLTVALLMLTLGFASCGDGGGDGESVVVKIGLNAPLSGVAAGYGQDIQAGIEMAINEINDDGGIKIGDTTYTFELKSSDDGMVPEQALANANQFVLEEGINIIWDPTANTIGPQMGINTKAGEEFLIMAYTSVPLYAQGANPLMITMPPPFSIYLPEWIKLSMGSGWMKVGMLQTTGAYGELWGSTFEKAWTGAGGEVVAKAPADYYTTTDYTANLTTVLAANPDVLFIGGPSDPTALVIEQARGLGFKGGFIVIDQAKLDDIADITGMEALEGAIGVLPVENGADFWPAMTDFTKMYEDEYGERVTWETAICYTGFMILSKAMEAAQSVDDVEAIRAGFADGDVSVTSGDVYPVGFEGIDDETGALLMPGTSTMVVDGVFVPGEPIEWWKL
ncbi:MAG: ethanolamine utilization protein EutJ [Actinobacteria bacterium]|jgi:branched-chain amino acid transport system substrate-binding protein|nr:MAG: ethanolamine utilization protein EutJ [Actinomycetota bacterium]